MCYKSVDSFRVTCLLSRQLQLQMLYSEWLDQDLVGCIQINLLPQSLAWLLGKVSDMNTSVDSL